MQFTKFKFKCISCNYLFKNDRYFVKKMNAMSPKPAFFIMCGDYTDAFPDEWPNVK